jgi:hypothetical protein
MKADVWDGIGVWKCCVGVGEYSHRP